MPHAEFIAESAGEEREARTVRQLQNDVQVLAHALANRQAMVHDRYHSPHSTPGNVTPVNWQACHWATCRQARALLLDRAGMSEELL